MLAPIMSCHAHREYFEAEREEQRREDERREAEADGSLFVFSKNRAML